MTNHNIWVSELSLNKLQAVQSQRKNHMSNACICKDGFCVFNSDILRSLLFKEKIILQYDLSFFVETCDEKMVNFVK